MSLEFEESYIVCRSLFGEDFKTLEMAPLLNKQYWNEGKIHLVQHQDFQMRYYAPL